MSARLAALRSRDFRLLFIGQIISLTGSQMQTVAVPYQIYKLTGSSLALGLVGLCRVIPVILFALGGGVIADALDRRRLMFLSQGLMAACSLTLAWTTRSGHITPAVLYSVIAVGGGALALDSPARQSLVPLLVPREHLANAIGLHAMAWEIAAIAGPSLAGLLIAWRGVFPVYVLDALSFSAVIGALLAMRHRAPPRTTTNISIQAAIDGLRFLRRSPLILSTMVLDFVATFFAGSLLLLPVYADRILSVGPRGLGLLYAAQPIGAALAAATLAARGTIRRQGVAVLWSIAIYGAAIAAFGLSRWLALSMVLLAISGAADTVSMVVRQTLRQLLTPDELRGRMTSVNMIFFIGGPQLGELEAGVVARAVGPRFSVASGGLACIVAAIVAAVALPSLRKLTSADYGIDSGARS
ncbi:MAG: major facilitator superfamily 1 [Myxococcales bacterium]|nr:major facilitator superfamily 1 [Myxococcales bacterium]